MEKYAHPEKKSELLWIVVKGWGCGWENVVLDVKTYMLMISFIKNIHNLKKLQWIIKKFQEKNGGYLVNKLESYQHFVCG